MVLGVHIAHIKNMSMLRTRRNVSSAIHLHMGPGAHTARLGTIGMVQATTSVDGVVQNLLGQDVPIALQEGMRNKHLLSFLVISKSLIYKLIDLIVEDTFFEKR